MKALTKTILVATLLAASTAAQAEWSANIGYASEYHFRGILQKNSSASAGLDYESGGFFVGTWAADVGDGLEVDGYFGYGTSLGDVDVSIGYTGYFYTGDFDETYQEINLGAAYGIVSLDVAFGEWDSPPSDAVCTDAIPPVCSPSKSDYFYYELTVAGESGLYATLGGFSQDFEGEYLQLGYDTTIADIDFGIALIHANDDLIGESEESLVFTIGKSFDL